MSPAPPTVEELQHVILQALEQQGEIADTRQLRLGTGTTEVPVAGSSMSVQTTIKGALDALASREVSAVRFIRKRKGELTNSHAVADGALQCFQP